MRAWSSIQITVIALFGTKDSQPSAYIEESRERCASMTYYSVTPLPQEQEFHLQSVPHLPFGPLLGPSSPVHKVSDEGFYEDCIEGRRSMQACTCTMGEYPSLRTRTVEDNSQSSPGSMMPLPHSYLQVSKVQIAEQFAPGAPLSRLSSQSVLIC